jgi:hypothetical protein
MKHLESLHDVAAHEPPVTGEVLTESGFVGNVETECRLHDHDRRLSLALLRLRGTG